jgi:hypothetical protein
VTTLSAHEAFFAAQQRAILILILGSFDLDCDSLFIWIWMKLEACLGEMKNQNPHTLHVRSEAHLGQFL